jgi:hypothetical protein
MSDQRRKPNTEENTPSTKPTQPIMRVGGQRRGGTIELPQPRVNNNDRTRRIIVYGSIITAILVGILVIAALLQLYVFEPNQSVASVGNVSITRTQLQNRMKIDTAQLVNRFNDLAVAAQQAQAQGGNDPQGNFLAQFYQQQLQQLGTQIDVNVISKQSLDALINEQIIRQEAQTRGITLSDSDIQTELEKQFGYYRVPLTPFPTYTPAPAGTPTSEPRVQPTSISDADLQSSRQRGVEFYKNYGYTEADFSKIFELSLLDSKLRESFNKNVKTSDQHYKFNYVRFNDEAKAKEALAQLTSKAIGFEALISVTNALTEPVGSGESVDWTLKANVDSRYGSEIVNVIDTAPVGQLSNVITSTFGGFYVIQTNGREMRPLSEFDLQSAQRKAYEDWIKGVNEDKTKVTRTDSPSTFAPKQVKDLVTRFRSGQLQ